MARAIMISDHLYNELVQLKRRGQSFTQVIDTLVHMFQTQKKQKYDLSHFAGAWSFLGEEKAEGILKVAKQVRKNWRPAPTW